MYHEQRESLHKCTSFLICIKIDSSKLFKYPCYSQILLHSTFFLIPSPRCVFANFTAQRTHRSARLNKSSDTRYAKRTIHYRRENQLSPGTHRKKKRAIFYDASARAGRNSRSREFARVHVLLRPRAQTCKKSLTLPVIDCSREID